MSIYKCPNPDDMEQMVMDERLGPIDKTSVRDVSGGAIRVGDLPVSTYKAAVSRTTRLRPPADVQQSRIIFSEGDDDDAVNGVSSSLCSPLRSY